MTHITFTDKLLINKLVFIFKKNTSKSTPRSATDIFIFTPWFNVLKENILINF